MPNAADPIAPKAPTSREIRVFLSSTFQDMDAERNHLLKQVFPKVRAACLARQVGFTEIDLRWGVTEEESKNGATVEICLKEIDRCRDFPPFFIGFLGERYGWIPRHDDLTAYWERHGESPYAGPIQAAVQRGISVTELEMELAVLATGAADKLAGHALFLLRNRALTDQVYQQATGRAPDPADRRFYDPADGQLDTLKDRIRHSGFLGVDGYPSVEVFGQTIADYLLAQLDHYFPADEIPSAFAQSNLAHATFRYHRLQNFLPRLEVRQAVTAALAQRADQPHLGPILLTGPSGQGKSALMADLARHLESAQGEVHWRVIDHYVGADDQNSLTAWLDRVLETLHPEIQDLTGPIPETPKDRKEALSSWLAMAARRTEQRGADQRPVRFALVLDALDQLSDGGKDLSLLTPEIIGPSATVIASVADGTPGREAARSFEAIQVPALTAELRTHLIRDTLARFRKGLAPQLVDTLAQAPQSGSPLFLTLALEELRLDARHATLARTLDDILAQPDAERLFLHAFLLDPDNNRPEQPDLAVRFMALLGASRAGLTEHELADLLALPSDPVLKAAPSAEEGKSRLPQVHLSRLLTNFQPFLLNKDGRRAPMHRIFGMAALAYAGEAEIREHLYTYFQPGYGSDWEGVEGRGAAEALYQITQLAGLAGEDQPNCRVRLVSDLGCLRVPAHLYKVAQEVTAEALMALTEEDKTEIGSRWQREVDAFDLNSVNLASADILGLVGWMTFLVYDRYRLPRRLAEALLTVQERVLAVSDPLLAGTMDFLGSVCLSMADYPPIRPFLERALAIREQNLGPTHLDTAESLSILAVYLCHTGDPADRAAARPLHERALAIQEQTLGPKHPATATSLYNLAVYHLETDLEAARTLYERALAIQEQTLGPQHPATASTLCGLATCLLETGDPHKIAEVRPLFERALTIKKQSLGAAHPDTAWLLNTLAGYLQRTGDPADLAAARPLFERALAIREQALGPSHPDMAWSLTSLAIYLVETGDPADRAAARPLYERALAIREQALGPSHPDTAASLNSLAIYLNETGDPADLAAARTLYERAMAICDLALGPMHPRTALSLNNLATYLKNTGDTRDRAAARPLYERALAIQEEARGPMHPDTANGLNNLAVYLEETGDLSDREAARPLYERALAIREHALGPMHPDTAISLSNLAGYLRRTGAPADLAAARLLHERALAIREHALGLMHPETADSLNNLAVSLELDDDPAVRSAARPLYERALAIREQVGPKHPATAMSLKNLAIYLEETGDAADLATARTLFERAMAIREQVLGPTHPDTATSLTDLAVYLEKTGDPADLAAARPYYERALACTEAALGPTHPDTASAIHNLALYLKSTGDPADLAAARPLYERALAIREEALGPSHTETAASISSMASYLMCTGNPDDLAAVRPLYERALAIRKEALGPMHPDTATSFNNLAVYLQGTGNPADFAAARPLYEHALASREQSLGPTHPETIRTLNNIAGYLQGTGDPADFAAARPLYERALAIREETLGLTHPDTATSLDNLAFYLEGTGDPADSAAARSCYERVLAIREQALGPVHPDTATSIINLADYLMASHEPTDQVTACSLYERVLPILGDTLSLDVEKTLRIKQNFAMSLYQAGRADDALPIIRDVVTGQHRLTGDTSLESASALMTLAVITDQTGDQVETEDALRRALAILTEQLEPDDPATQWVQRRLAELTAKPSVEGGGTYSVEDKN